MLPPLNYPPDGIHLLVALTVVAALAWAAPCMHPGNCLAIFTDNSNTVNMFYSLHALPLYNPLLIYAVDILLSAQIKLRVYHTPGIHNNIAGLTISSFIPPHITLGARKK